MLKRIHPIAGALATLLIACFWLATFVSEIFGSIDHIITVKTTIPWGFLILIPALALTGGSGFKMSGESRVGMVQAKVKRMSIVAPIGLFVLIPAAFYLAHKSELREFDTSFYSVQLLELLAGALNLTLLGLNIRDGMKLSGRRT